MGIPPGGSARWRGASRHPIGEEFQFKTSGDEVDYKNASLLLTKIMLCRKLRCQKGFKLKLVSVLAGLAGAWRDGNAGGGGA